MSSAGPILLVFLLLQACGTTKEKPEKPAENSDSVNTTVASGNDTIPKPPPPPEPALAPREAKVLGSIVRLGSGEMELKVSKIEGYGSSTPPIAVNDTLKVRAGEQIIQKNEELRVGTEVRLLVYYNISREEASAPRWSLVKLYSK